MRESFIYVHAPKRISPQRPWSAHSTAAVTDEDGLASLCGCLREAEMGREAQTLAAERTQTPPFQTPPDESFSDFVGWLSKPRHSSFLCICPPSPLLLGQEPADSAQESPRLFSVIFCLSVCVRLTAAVVPSRNLRSFKEAEAVRPC